MNINFKNRAELKSFFKKNAIPTAGNFADFIDAGVNQKEDGLFKPGGEPLSLEASLAATKPAIRFFETFAGNPTWTLSLIEPVSQQSAFVVSDALGNARLSINQTGAMTVPGAITVGSLSATTASATTLTTTGLLSVSAGANVTGAPLNVGTSAATAQPLNVWGALTANSTATVTGLLTANGGIATTGTINAGVLAVSGRIGINTPSANSAAALDVKGPVMIDSVANPWTSPLIYTGVGGSELNRYLVLVNSPGFLSSSGLKAGGVLVSDSYTYANPGKMDLVVKGKVAIGIPTAGTSLHVNGGATVGPFAPSSQSGGVYATGAGATLGFARRNLGAWPPSPAAGDSFEWYNPDGVARLWTTGNGDLLTVKSNGFVGFGLSDPQFRLDINGRVRLHPDANSAGIWLTGQGTSTSAAGDVAFIGLRDDLNIGFWGNTGTPGWRLSVEIGTGNLTTTGNLILDHNGDPIIYTGVAAGELNRYLLLVNSPGSASASGLKAGGVLVSDTYSYASPSKNDLIVKGRVAIGKPTTAVTAPLHVNGSAVVGPFAPTTSAGQLFLTGGASGLALLDRTFSAWPANPGPGESFLLYNINRIARLYTDGVGDVLTVKSNGDLNILGANATKVGGANTWATSSDARLKQHIEPLHDALERLLQLRGATYEWREPEKQGNETGRQIGFIGQEVEQVFPDWITEGEDGYKLLTIRGFEALAVEAIRELRAENQALKQRYQELHAELARLAARSQTTGDTP